MTASTGVFPWTLTMPAGSSQNWLFTLTIPATGAPYPITGSTWEYVARLTATDLTSPPLVSVTTTPSAEGVLTVTSTSSVSSVQLTLARDATAGIAPGEYAHALWQNPGDTDAFTWLAGSLIITGNPQP